MKVVDLQGWNVSVRKIQLPGVRGNGAPEYEDGYELVFEEVKPPTGHVITFKMSRALRDYVVRELTGGIVLAGGDLPNV